MLRHLRIFLASPGDVTNERVLALQVLEQLPYNEFLRGKVTLEVVAWDKPGAGTPMQATMTPQEAIAKGLPKPSECDLVVAVFWSRMGTPLPEDWVKPQALRYLAGTEFESLDARYLSGTEWEYFDALQAAEAQGRPKVLVYRRTEKQVLDQDDPEFDKKRQQWKLVKAFFDSFRNPDDSLRRGYNEYLAPAAFAKDFEDHLQKMIKEELETPGAATTRPETARAEPPLWQGSPFPGLRPFINKDWPIFFGRGRETDELIRKLADPDNRFLAVIGASGSGKSSLVWAGLIPRLLGQAASGADDQPRFGPIRGSQDWVSVRFTPGELGDNPLIATASVFRPVLEQQGRRVLDEAEKLQQDAGALDELVRLRLEKQPKWAELLLFVDQFEETFTVVGDKYRGPFIALLTHAARMPRLRTVVTVRADFYHRCVEWPELAELLRNGSFPLAAPDVGALHEMIARPAERAGLRFEDGLVQRILTDTGSEPGALALMAFALNQLYDARNRGQLTHAAYEAFEGVQGAIGKQAEDTFRTLNSQVKAKLGDVFRELVEVDEQGTATRRRAPLEQLTGSKMAETLIQALTDARLLVTSKGDNGEAAIVEVAHEALFRSWPRLAKWIENTGDDLRLRRQIRQAAADWEKRERKPEYRWLDERVVEVVKMLGRLGLQPDDFTETEQDFLGPLDRDRMLAELRDPATTHERRATIGVRLSLLGDPRSGVGLREDGLPDLVWCQVPSGEIELEGVEGVFTVEPLYIAKYPITWIQYRAFLEASDGFGDSAWWQGLWFQIDEPGKQFNRRDNHPAENLCWLEAVAYCRWLSDRLGYEIRLPTEWEWQQAATGGNPANEYPWGPDWDSGRTNAYESDLNRSTAVGMYPHGASPVGALDLSGNVFEWCLNEYDNPERVDPAGEARRVVRGGSWLADPAGARASSRDLFDPDHRFNDCGVRVVCVAPLLDR